MWLYKDLTVYTKFTSYFKISEYILYIMNISMIHVNSDQVCKMPATTLINDDISQQSL